MTPAELRQRRQALHLSQGELGLALGYGNCHPQSAANAISRKELGLRAITRRDDLLLSSIESVNKSDSLTR